MIFVPPLNAKVTKTIGIVAGKSHPFGIGMPRFRKSSNGFINATPAPLNGNMKTSASALVPTSCMRCSNFVRSISFMMFSFVIGGLPSFNASMSP
ncbi:MAG: hypothetical protein ACD_65C00323G0003 [uncultured bacterium]|nr:MAG: hypothetical protein ACD_65C00323G0003 [uncultured bacterium]